MRQHLTGVNLFFMMIVFICMGFSTHAYSQTKGVRFPVLDVRDLQRSESISDNPDSRLETILEESAREEEPVIKREPIVTGEIEVVDTREEEPVVKSEPMVTGEVETVEAAESEEVIKKDMTTTVEIREVDQREPVESLSCPDGKVSAEQLCVTLENADKVVCTNGKTETILIENTFGPSGITTDGASIFVTNDDGNVLKVNPTTFDSNVIFSPGNNPNGAAFSQKYNKLVITTASDGKLYKCGLDGKDCQEVTLEMEGRPFNNLQGVAVRQNPDGSETLFLADAERLFRIDVGYGLEEVIGAPHFSSEGGLAAFKDARGSFVIAPQYNPSFYVVQNDAVLVRDDENLESQYRASAVKTINNERIVFLGSYNDGAIRTYNLETHEWGNFYKFEDGSGVTGMVWAKVCGQSTDEEDVPQSMVADKEEEGSAESAPVDKLDEVEAPDELVEMEETTEESVSVYKSEEDFFGAGKGTKETYDESEEFSEDAKDEDFIESSILIDELVLEESDIEKAVGGGISGGGNLTGGGLCSLQKQGHVSPSASLFIGFLIVFSMAILVYARSKVSVQK